MLFPWYLAFGLLSVVFTEDMPIEMDVKNMKLELMMAGCSHFRYEVKTCKEQRVYLYDVKDSAIAHLIIGGWGNKKSHIKIISTGQTRITQTQSVFACNAFRWFWVSWNNGSIAYGKGTVPGKNVLIDLEDPSGRRVKRVQLMTGNIASRVKIGHFVAGSKKYEKDLTERYMTTHWLQSIPSTSPWACATECSGRAECGLFNFHPGQRMCYLINRKSQWQHHAIKSGWQTWRMLYC